MVCSSNVSVNFFFFLEEGGFWNRLNKIVGLNTFFTHKMRELLTLLFRGVVEYPKPSYLLQW